MYQKVVGIDFDYTIARDLTATPMYGARGCLQWLRDTGWRIVVITARRTEEELLWLEGYLIEHKIPFDEVTNRKVPAHVYVGDRALTFNGDWEETILEIIAFEPWQYRSIPEPPLFIGESMIKAILCFLKTIFCK